MKVGQAIVFGAKDVLPLHGFPEGRARIRIRNDDWVQVFVRPPEGGIKKFLVEEKDSKWCPAGEVGVNLFICNPKNKIK